MTKQEKAALIEALVYLDTQSNRARQCLAPFEPHKSIAKLKDLLLPDRPPMDRYIERQTPADCEFVGCKKAKTCSNIRGKKLVAPCTGRICK